MTIECHVRLSPLEHGSHARLHVPQAQGARYTGLMSLREFGDVGPSGELDHPGKQRLFRLTDALVGTAVGVRQVHSRRVAVVGPTGTPGADEADGLIAAEAGFTLTITVADCMPILLVDRRRGAYGLLHSGWRGTGILAEAVDLLVFRFHTDPEDLTAVFGPCICAACYAVPAERASYFRREFGGASAVERSGTWFLDLRQANVLLARRKGVGEVVVYDDCTSCSRALGSYRREGPDAFTRMLVALTATQTS